MKKEITLKVNDKEITVPEGTLLIDACEQNGIHIPRLCYHEGLFPSGNCRLCQVHIEKNPKTVPACMTYVAENMVVQTETPDLVEMRKAILEFVLINHPLDCPICDKAGECMLQDQFMLYSREKSRFIESKVAKGKHYHFSERITYDAERCVTCSRCIRFTRDVSKSNKLGMIKRGDRSFVALAPGEVFDDPYSYCVSDICPVGALTNRQFRFRERVWNLSKTDAICAGCSRGCNISLQHKDNQILRVMPRFNAEVNRHWMCDYGRDYYTQANGEIRLTGISINGQESDYSTLVESISEVLKANAASTAFILSSHATNEELAVARQLCEASGVKTVIQKSDRVWLPDSKEVEKDNFLITADKTPNLNGIKNYFPQAEALNDAALKNMKYAFVWGPLPTRLKAVKTIVLSTIIDESTQKADWLIAGKTPAEKSGSFTNCEGKIQKFQQATQGVENYDDQTFLQDILNKLA